MFDGPENTDGVQNVALFDLALNLTEDAAPDTAEPGQE